MEKLWAYLCELVELIRGSQAPFWIHLLYLSYLSQKDLEKFHLLTVLTLGSRESLGSLFGLVFSSFVLILSQKACGKSPGPGLEDSFCRKNQPGHFLAHFIDFVITNATEPKELWAYFVSLLSLIEAHKPTFESFHLVFHTSVEISQLKYLEKCHLLI